MTTPSYLVGKRISLIVTVSDKATAALVNPSALTFRLRPPPSSPYALSNYVWNGTVWVSSEAVIAVPTKGALGLFTIQIDIPYANNARGPWAIGWLSIANGSGFGAGSGEANFEVKPTDALSL